MYNIQNTGVHVLKLHVHVIVVTINVNLCVCVCVCDFPRQSTAVSRKNIRQSSPLLPSPIVRHIRPFLPHKLHLLLLPHKYHIYMIKINTRELLRN